MSPRNLDIEMAPVLCDALCCHHAAPDRPLAEAKDPRLAALVRIADLAVRQKEWQGGAASSAACADEEAWAAIESAAGQLPPEQRFEMLERFVTELKDMPRLVF